MSKVLLVRNEVQSTYVLYRARVYSGKWYDLNVCVLLKIHMLKS